jgi:hypothetical protein
MDTYPLFLKLTAASHVCNQLRRSIPSGVATPGRIMQVKVKVKVLKAGVWDLLTKTEVLNRGR